MDRIEVKEVTVAELKQTANAIVIDIRDPDSFEAGHIPGARNITGENVQEFIAETEKSRPVIVCCYHGISSLGAAEYLQSEGFSNVASLIGGYSAWQE